MERYLSIGKENLKFNMPAHIAAAVLVLLISPLIFGTRNLDQMQTARILEIYVVFIGIVLMTPIFLPEQNEDLRDMVRSRYTSQITIYTIRAVQAVIVMAVLLFIFILMLIIGNCRFPVAEYFFGAFAGLFFLGCLGAAAYSISDNIVAGYMIPIIYYMFNYGSGEKYLQKFYLFSMIKGSYTEKIYLGCLGIILLTAGILYRSLRRK